MKIDDIRKLPDDQAGIEKKLELYMALLKKEADERKMPVVQVGVVTAEILQYNITSTEMIGQGIDQPIRRAHAASEVDILTLALRAVAGRSRSAEELATEQFLLDQLHEAYRLYRDNL